MHRFLIRIFFACLIALNIQAQESVSDTTSVLGIVARLNQIEPGKGRVRIVQDEVVASRIGTPAVTHTGEDASISDYVELSGWRIQVFAGNNQRISKNEAFRKEADIKMNFSNWDTYVTYTAPFWRLRVGDFQTYQDAREAMMLLRRRFPSYGKEMSIVRDKIRIRTQIEK